MLAPPASAQPVAPPDLVALSDVDPTILQEIRYFTPHNFVGDPIDGYQQPMCILTREAAEGLKRAQQAFVEQGYTLKVYDCYRPQRAVDEFVAWGENPLADRSGVGQQRDNRGRVSDQSSRQRRSASLASRIADASTRTPVASTRARARAITSLTDGLAAVSTSRPRRNSCSDLPDRAARAASSSRTPSGISRTVMATMPA